MARVSRVLRHLSEEELKDKIATAPSARRQQKWMIIYNALVAPRPATEIAKHTSTSVRTVHQVISDYNRLGVAAIETAGQGGRRNCYLSWQEEEEFLAPFMTSATQGELSTIQRIHQTFEQKVGSVVRPSVIYRLLERHGWRKVMPRPHHPEADVQAQEAFKKTSPCWCKRPWPTKRLTTLVLSSSWQQTKVVLDDSDK
jgi:transposase